MSDFIFKVKKPLTIKSGTGVSLSESNTPFTEKDFEPENPTSLENLTDKTCRWPIGHPDEKDFYFCGRTPMDERIYCKLHVLHAYQPRGQKGDEPQINNNEVQNLIPKKVKRA